MIKPIFFAGLALALSVPAWSQPQGAPPPPPAADNRPAPDNGPPPVGGPIQNSRRRGDGAAGATGNLVMNDGWSNSPFADPSGGASYQYALPPGPPVPPPVSMFADGPFLFVLRGDTLMQFDKRSLVLLKSVELPHSVPTVVNYPQERVRFVPVPDSRVYVPGGPYYRRDEPNHRPDPPKTDEQPQTKTSPPLVKRP